MAASPTVSQPLPQSQPQPERPSDTPPAQNSALPANNPILPAISTTDPGTGPRPRDARTVHLVLSQMGVPSYQERVPLQLIDFAYRYTSTILSDAYHLAQEGYNQQSGGTGGSKGPSHDDVMLATLRMAADARQANQFTGGKLSKEHLKGRAQDVNKVRLPHVDLNGPNLGMRLPHERFLLTGRSWDLNAQWESEDALEMEDIKEAQGSKDDTVVNGKREEDDEEREEDDAEGGDDGFEQIFGTGGEDEDEGTGEGEDEDAEMGND